MIEGLLILALLWTVFCFSINRTIKRAEADRARAEQAMCVEEFLEELKADAAYAAVNEWPYGGVDVLGMLHRHELATSAEIDQLYTDARRRLPEDEPAEPYVPPRNGHAGRPLDDEIPF